MIEKRNNFSIYKPNKSNNGAALQLDFNKFKKSIFIECANQNGERSFDWGQKVTLKLSATDIGAILSVLNNKAVSTKLYHDPGKGDYASSKEISSNILSVSKNSYGYNFSISQKKGNSLTRIALNITFGECELMIILLQQSIRSIYEW